MPAAVPRLAVNSEVGGEQQVVEELGDLAGSERAEVDHRVAVGREHRAAELDGTGFSAGHHQQAAFGGRRAAAADRRVDQANAPGGGLLGQALAGVRVDGAVHRDHAAGAEPRQHAALAGEDLLDVGVTDHADAHQVTGRGQLGGGAGDLDGGIGERLEGGRAPRPQRDRIARADDPARHRTALAAQADEPDPHQRGVLLFSAAHRVLMRSFISARRVRTGYPLTLSAFPCPVSWMSNTAWMAA